VYYVQLPQWNAYAWTYAREEQRKALDLAGTGMVVTIDLDFANDIHPPNKIDVGERLARWPLAKVYGRDVEVSGPMYKSAAARGASMVIRFNHIAGGLLVGQIKDGGKGTGQVIASKTGQLNGFELVGSDGVWYKAKAVIAKQTIVVTSVKVNKPVAVRYACHPVAPKSRPWNLYNKAGLPASPFCSDWSHMPYDHSKNGG
jgi:sialate O-acetylesterase